MTPIELLLSKLPRAKRQGEAWAARCPAHEDKRPSLSISEGEGGRALVCCHAGCKPEEIVAALGLKLSDLMPESPTTARPMPRATRKPTAKAPRTPATFATAAEAVAELERQHGPRMAAWTYHGADGGPVGLVVRWDKATGKEIRPVSKTPAGWIIGGMPEPRPLYRLPELLARPGERVLVCEGEKATDAAAGLGYLATTSPHGSKSASKADWTPLAGREVVILPDADEAGEKYAADVAAILVKLTPPAAVRIMDTGPDGMTLPPKGDIADWVERYRNGGHDETAMREDLERLIAQATVKANPKEAGPVLVCLADVEPREIKWLWPGRVPLGRITLLVGRPGEGKSFLTTDMAARITTGTPWPDLSECPIGSVILVSAEDDPGDTIRPRLDAHNADVRKVHLLSAVRRIGEDGQAHEVLFTLADVAALEAALKALPDCRLIVVDPIGSFLGGDTDAHRDNEVRGVLAPVAKLAEKYGPAVLVVAHRRKSAGSIADDLALGSRAFTGIARAVWHLTRDTDNKARRLLLPGKNNLAPEGDGLAFAIVGDPAAVVWEADPVAMSADDALAQENNAGEESKPGPEPEARSHAAEWLRELLKAGPMESGKIKEEGKAAGYAWRTLHRAKDELGIRPYRERFGGNWIWKLPDGPAALSCQAPQEQGNLASWHDSKNPSKTGDSKPGTVATCQDDSSWHDSEKPDGDWGEV